MDKAPDNNVENHFKSLESRYRAFLLRKVKSYLDNAGYRGTAFMYLLLSKDMLYKNYRETPLLKDIINNYEGSFLFDKRTAVTQALQTAKKLQKEYAGTRQFDGWGTQHQNSDVRPYEYRLQLLKETGRDKVGYLPDPRDLLKAGAGTDLFVVKLLVRFTALKTLFQGLGHHFSPEAVAEEAAKSTVGEKHERENQVAEAIGRKYFPELFGSGPEPAVVPEASALQPELEANFGRHEWLGTQYQLGELFIELERKGWIKQKVVKTIKASFTNSNTIGQVLKPGVDVGEPTYPQIFTEGYRPVFDGIKRNKKSRTGNQ